MASAGGHDSMGVGGGGGREILYRRGQECWLAASDI